MCVFIDAVKINQEGGMHDILSYLTEWQWVVAVAVVCAVAHYGMRWMGW